MACEKTSNKAPQNRQPALLALQNLKMARSAHAYVRGNTSQFYTWLNESGTDSIPTGPPRLDLRGLPLCGARRCWKRQQKRRFLSV